MKKIALTGANIIDGTGKEMLTGNCILIDGDSISYIGPGKEEIASGYSVIDMSGLTIIPGIIDCHVHLGGTTEPEPLDFVLQDNRVQTAMSVAQAQSLLNNGITTVRDISVNGYALRYLFDHEYLNGPRIIPCGPGLSRTAGHGDAHLVPMEVVKAMHPWAVICDTHDEIKKSIRENIRKGSEFIKVWASGGGFWEKDSGGDQHYNFEDLKLIVEEAGYLGLPVAAHAENVESAWAAACAGVWSIEHGEKMNDECIAMMKEKGIFQVPTLRLIAGWYETYATTPSKKSSLAGSSTEEYVRITLDLMRETFHKSIAAGIKIAVGSDSYCSTVTPYGQITHEEIRYLSNWGLGPMGAIVAATKVGAELLGLSKVTGTLEMGKKADMIALSKNPLDDIANLNSDNIKMVMKEGKIIRNLVKSTD